MRETLQAVGYKNADPDIDPINGDIQVRLNKQSDQIACGVEDGANFRAGNQRLTFGYATDETSSPT